MECRYLTREEIETIHKYVAIRYGFKPAVLLPGNLDLCVDSPTRTLFGVEIFETLFNKAACLLREINKLHPFGAGNKRTAYVVADVFLNLNGFRLRSEVSEAVDISMRTASCTAEMPEITQWIHNHVYSSHERLGE